MQAILVHILLSKLIFLEIVMRSKYLIFILFSSSIIVIVPNLVVIIERIFFFITANEIKSETKLIVFPQLNNNIRKDTN